MADCDWRPSVGRQQLQRRADLYRQVRAFFEQRSVLEVDIPCVAPTTVTDVNIESIEVNVAGCPHYLQTSPEYFMKRLLAAGSGDIYSLGHAYRQGEAGRRHNPEFTMLEWYRLGYNDRQLMDEAGRSTKPVSRA